MDRACRAEQCLKESVATSGVHLLTFQVNYDRERYACAVAVEVRDRAEGRLLYKESSSSPVCPAADLLDHTSKAARVACGELKRTPAASTPAPVQLNAAAPAAAAARDPGTSAGDGVGRAGRGIAGRGRRAAVLRRQRDAAASRHETGKRDCPCNRRTTKVRGAADSWSGALLGGWGTYRLIGVGAAGRQCRSGATGLAAGRTFPVIAVDRHGPAAGVAWRCWSWSALGGLHRPAEARSLRKRHRLRAGQDHCNVYKTLRGRCPRRRRRRPPPGYSGERPDGVRRRRRRCPRGRRRPRRRRRRRRDGRDPMPPAAAAATTTARAAPRLCRRALRGLHHGQPVRRLINRFLRDERLRGLPGRPRRTAAP